ncbi:MAG: hypothetical protein ABSC94_19920 [Polyangiaceae bacterium]|jgi:phage tail tape-measure protein
MKAKQVDPAFPSEGHGTDVGAIAGELVGAVVGGAAGPVGVAVGMTLGAMAGALAGHVLEDEGRRARAHDEELDETIGVSGGDLGAARPDMPPAQTAAPSAASSGASAEGGSPTSAEGPIQSIDEDA